MNNSNPYPDSPYPYCKILFVIDNLTFGGGERVFSQLINNISRDRYRPYLATQPGGQFHQSIPGDKIVFYPLDFSKKINPSLSFKLAQIIRKNKIDIIHGQGARAEFYARWAKKLSGRSKYVSTIAMPVDGFDVTKIRKEIYRFFDSCTERYVDQFLVVSDALKEFLILKRGIPSYKVRKIYNGVELDLFQKDSAKSRLRKQLNIPADAPVIGAVGRLVWQKGFEYLIRATPEIVRAVSNAVILIIGEGPHREMLEDLARNLKVENRIVFTGFRKDIRQMLSVIDILAVPSLLEGFPMIILEAMATSKPIVATNIIGINEQLIHGESGVLVPPKCNDSLSKEIIDLLRDDKLLKYLGRNARRRVEKYFSIDKMITDTMQVYQSLLPNC